MCERGSRDLGGSNVHLRRRDGNDGILMVRLNTVLAVVLTRRQTNSSHRRNVVPHAGVVVVLAERRVGACEVRWLRPLIRTCQWCKKRFGTGGASSGRHQRARLRGLPFLRRISMRSPPSVQWLSASPLFHPPSSSSMTQFAQESPVSRGEEVGTEDEDYDVYLWWPSRTEVSVGHSSLTCMICGVCQRSAS
ncbi:hypothetical protein FA95DRAFT_501467 [Auriscalpium vulgare]|uniref:Uncharacterized protein n=1 Tax=Auriscalpium vulgare TaxID=40419 RepID=A0ACB8S489_9AGAM|nr:hypothetical protein FA95DRAFT_501467 [Auriscalpium vulgare]